jgi:hypothetical protein
MKPSSLNTASAEAAKDQLHASPGNGQGACASKGSNSARLRAPQTCARSHIFKPGAQTAAGQCPEPPAANPCESKASLRLKTRPTCANAGCAISAYIAIHTYVENTDVNIAMNYVGLLNELNAVRPGVACGGNRATAWAAWIARAAEERRVQGQVGRAAAKLHGTQAVTKQPTWLIS